MCAFFSPIEYKQTGPYCLLIFSPSLLTPCFIKKKTPKNPHTRTKKNLTQNLLLWCFKPLICYVRQDYDQTQTICKSSKKAFSSRLFYSRKYRSYLTASIKTKLFVLYYLILIYKARKKKKPRSKTQRQ